MIQPYTRKETWLKKNKKQKLGEWRNLDHTQIAYQARIFMYKIDY